MNFIGDTEGIVLPTQIPTFIYQSIVSEPISLTCHVFLIQVIDISFFKQKTRLSNADVARTEKILSVYRFKTGNGYKRQLYKINGLKGRFVDSVRIVLIKIAEAGLW